MITADMREYDYYLYADKNEYGQQVLIKDENGEPLKQGKVKLCINHTTTNIQDNLLYKNAQYIALTHDRNISDLYAIQYGEELLKVLYINPKSRYKQVFLSNI